jgi:7,8-dihydropterin-6-yl-methyl-4-(beta-D-ribofuranosyl)aminobenzene 5'-phosphate synthase
MKRLLFGGTGAVAFLLAGQLLSAQGPGVRITYLYDNTLATQGTTPDWGFACLLEGRGRTILFDTGAQPEILRHNMATLKVDPARVQAVVLSHEHGDHTVGIDALPAAPGLPVYIGEHFRLPAAAVAALARIGATRIAVTSAKPVQIFPGFAVSEEIARNGAYEEALVVDTPAGSVIVVGCAHPGIVAMLRRIAETTKRPIHMVIGGFHLLQTSSDDVKRIIADFKALGVAWTGPTHCTGDEAIRLFREAYGDHFIAGGVGTIVDVPKERSSAARAPSTGRRHRSPGARRSRGGPPL